MSHVRVALIAGLLVVSLAAGIATADPPRPGSEDNGLSQNESATLWSHDTDQYLTQAAYQHAYDSDRTAVQQVANGTDITFTRPPATAATWTRNDFTDLTAGGTDTAVYPPHANLTGSTYIEDAHATIFAVHPSTRGHLAPADDPLYIAPNGTVRGFIDYRVRVPDGRSTGATTTEWSLVDHSVERVRLQRDDDVITTQGGTHTPTIAYQTDHAGDATLTLEADIQVRLKRTVRTTTGDASTIDVSYATDSVTVSDRLQVDIYTLTASVHHAAYPDGDDGVAVFQSGPWQELMLAAESSSRVRGVWRFYTARDTNWDTLVQSTHTDQTTVASDAHPVYVHTYPSRIGPRTEPVRDGPERIDIWGQRRPSPAGSLGENITIDVVEDPYTTTYGIAVRADTIDRDALRLTGIVRGVNASPAVSAPGAERQLRASNLTATVVEQSSSEATLKLTLRDGVTDAPIVLTGDRRDPLRGTPQRGYIAVADQRIRTNESGVAYVNIDEPGIYTATYHPEPWLSHDPAYVRASATTRWHPLTTIEGWVVLIIEVGWRLLPFAVMVYAGTRLLRLLTPNSGFTHP